MRSELKLREVITTEAWNTTGEHVHRRSLLHMSFYWGYKSEILFKGWPGTNPLMYALALLFVFTLAVLVEWLNNFDVVKPEANRVAAGFFKTGLHVIRSGMSYMVMLAVMSFNGGVFLVALFGHAIGYLIFRSRVFKKGGSDH